MPLTNMNYNDQVFWSELHEKRGQLSHLMQQAPVCDPLQDGLSSLSLVDIMGTDLSVANDARVSYGR